MLMTPEEFRRYGYSVVDWIASYRERLESLPVAAPIAPGAIKARLPDAPPEFREPFDDVMRDLEEIILPGLTHWQHPSFFGYFPANAALSSVLGDLLSSGIGALGLSWQSSPALTELEECVSDWLRQMVGLSPAWSGVIQDTASTSTLLALLCARERSIGFETTDGGLQAAERPLVVYASSQAHSSVEKAATLAGFGRGNVRKIVTDEKYAMSSKALAQTIRKDLDEGRVPCAVVGTTGTTTSTAIDPIKSIAEIAKEYKIWMHVDAALAGSAMILPECRNLWEGIEDADSLVLNAHKWLGAVFDCSLYYVRDSEYLIRVMSTNPSYLQTAADGRVTNYRDWGIPLGRRFRALKLWCLIRSEGVEGLQVRLRADMDHAQWLASQVAFRPGWEVVAPVPLQTVCVRHQPDGLSGAALDQHTLHWVERINQSGAAYLTPAILDERWVVRVSIGAEMTRREHVAALWEQMIEAAEAK